MQSGFRSGYGCVTVTLKFLNDVTIALESKQCCAAIFNDLVKAFDTVDHSILVVQLMSIVFLRGLKIVVFKVKTSALSATACHQWSTTRLDPRPHALHNLHQQYSSGSMKLSHPFICR